MSEVTKMLGKAICSLVALLAFVSVPVCLEGAEVTVAWDPNTEPDLAGYRVYYGVDAALPATQVDAGMNTSVTLSNLLDGTTYFIYATAYNTAGLESAPSETLTHTVGEIVSTPVVTAPVITRDPLSQTAAAGSQITLSVEASGSEPLVYQWYKNGILLVGATGSTLSSGTVQQSDAGSYYVRVSNAAGMVQSSSATLEVIAAPQIAAQPVSRTVNPGADVSFQVSATGTGPLAFQWHKNGVAIGGANSSALLLTSVQESASGSYHVTVSNAAGSVSSASATLAVQTEIDPPVVVAHPVSQTVAAGSAIMLTVQASGSEPLTYQWYKDGVRLLGATGPALSSGSVQESDEGSYYVTVSNGAGSAQSSAAALEVIAAPEIVSGPASQTVEQGVDVTLQASATGTEPLAFQWHKDGVAIPGATSSTLLLGDAGAAAAGSYHVTVSNAAGSASSAPAILTVNTPLEAPVILAQPVSQSAAAGSAVSLAIEAGGTDPLVYQWFKDGVLVPGATGPVLSFGAVQEADSGSYYATVSNEAGTAQSSPATLEVIVAPEIASGPDSQKVEQGGQAVFQVTATGTGPLAFQWHRDGAAIPGATSSTFVLASVQPASEGSYHVTVSNAAGSVASAQAILMVEISVEPPVIQAQPLSQTVAAGSAVSLSVSAGGSEPLVYQWYKDGVAIDGATNPALSFAEVEPEHAGSYYATVSNEAGTVQSSLAVVEVSFTPEITSQPASQTVELGMDVTLQVSATGTGPLSFQWHKDGVVIPGASSGTLLLTSVEEAAAGKYHATVSNAAGSVSSTAATLKVVAELEAPAVLTHPFSQTVAAGDSVIFAAGASGTGPLSYQWFKDGVALPGETKMALSIKAAAVPNAGTYWLEVSNAAGKAASAAATLDVLVTAKKAAPRTNGKLFGTAVREDFAAKVLAPDVEAGLVYVTIAGTPGVTYRIESSTEIASAEWQPMAAIVAPENGLIGLSTELSRAPGMSFFRAVAISSPAEAAN